MFTYCLSHQNTSSEYRDLGLSESQLLLPMPAQFGAHKRGLISFAESMKLFFQVIFKPRLCLSEAVEVRITFVQKALSSRTSLEYRG